jgi:hypothetical protein
MLLMEGAPKRAGVAKTLQGKLNSNLAGSTLQAIVTELGFLNYTITIINMSPS